MLTSAFVNVACDFDHPGGFGTHARGFVNAFRDLAPVAVLNRHGSLMNNNTVARISLASTTISIGPVGMNPSGSGKLQIGWVPWETTNVPKRYLDQLLFFDIIWAPSTFTKGIFDDALRGARPVYVVPEGVDTTLFHPAPQTDTPANTFRFLSVGKWEQRKAHDYLIAAFLQAFGDRSATELIIRLTASSKDRSSIPSLSRTHPSVHFVGPCSDSALAQLYRSAHAFALSTRSESWGLPIIEAMSTALPCVVTEYGGHLDYCNGGNAFLVPPAGLVPVSDPIYYAESVDWGVWAEPSVDRLAESLREVRENSLLTLERGTAARANVLAKWTWEHSAQLAHALLRRYSEGVQ